LLSGIDVMKLCLLKKKKMVFFKKKNENFFTLKNRLNAYSTRKEKTNYAVFAAAVLKMYSCCIFLH